MKFQKMFCNHCFLFLILFFKLFVIIRRGTIVETMDLSYNPVIGVLALTETSFFLLSANDLTVIVFFS